MWKIIYGLLTGLLGKRLEDPSTCNGNNVGSYEIKKCPVGGYVSVDDARCGRYSMVSATITTRRKSVFISSLNAFCMDFTTLTNT